MAVAAMTKNVPDVASVFKSSKPMDSLLMDSFGFKLFVALLTLLMHALGASTVVP